jgi:protocatechuate 3,4-dioxygenase beta subunit
MRLDASLLRSLSRRQLLITGAAAVTSMKGMASTPSCTLSPEQEEGPYYVESTELRSDITEGKLGVPVKLRIALVNAKGCTPVENAVLDIWHCDATGVYSGFTSSNPDGPGRGRGPGRPGEGGMPQPPPGPRGFGARGPRKIDPSRFLRGMQMSNSQGMVEFATLYPGWYSGRAIHIHMKVHLGGEGASEMYAGGHVAHTGQLFFPEDISERVARTEPYASRLTIHRTTQEEDGIFQSQHGSGSMVKLERIRNGSDSEGFVASVTLAVHPEATPLPVGGGGGRGRGPRAPL